jgi:LPS-assembly lipoprotein
MRAALAATLLVLVAGCGFHLRGSVSLSPRMSAPYLEVPDRYTPFYGALVAALEDAGAVRAAGAETASAVVRVHKDETGRNVLTISARNTPQEYEVFYTVAYSVVADGKEILPRQELSLTRVYAYDDTALLAKQHEEDDIRAALARELAALVMRRLAAL